MKEDNTTKVEWVDKGKVGDMHNRMLHEPCGTTVFVLMGQTPVCPKCQPGALPQKPTEHPKKA